MLAGGVWALAETFSNLSPAPKILLSFGAFCVTFAVILVSLKAALSKRSSKPESQTAATPAFPPSASESFVLKEFKQTQIQNEELKTKNAQLQAERDKLKPDANRMRARRKLKNHYYKGVWLYEERRRGDSSAKWEDEVERWENLTYATIRITLGKTQADFFLGEQPTLTTTNPSERGSVEVSLDYLSDKFGRLNQLIDRVDSIPLRPEFDPEE